MNRWYGKIGFGATVEVRKGVWRQEIVERNYYGELIRNFRKLESSGNLNDNINVANEISIVADPFAYENFHSMLYVTYMGAKWKVTDVEVQYPRLILTLGGLYNGNTD